MLDPHKTKSFMDAIWDREIVPILTDYIRIPNKSPAFDPEWEKHGYMNKVVEMFTAWANKKLKQLPGASLEVVRLPGRTPLIFIEIPGATGNPEHSEGPSGATILMYGHLDKQPEMTGWSESPGPWEPVLKNDRLYGRGGADDGYAMFAAISALLALKEQNIAHARAVIVIEACEESGSPDLPFYIDHLAVRIGTPDLVVCLDSGCGNYDQLWLTASLRGMVIGNLTVRVLTEGVHSGDASGVVASSFRIARQLLSRIEDEASGQMKIDSLFVQIPPERQEQAKAAASILGDEVYTKLPFAPGMKPMTDDPAQLILNRTWRPQLAITAMAGYPTPENGGNVLLPFTTLKLSLRLPPTCEAEPARMAVKKALEDSPPDGATVEFD
ncbi:MAG TPA: M20/M25/M40 family metallo-hydrolase, partial [Rhizomicrobium sp.]|nr:M20/M25/M40 family metallo-hydrolase [Rhizomicrobium sp.]